jgi:protein-S-isoprenylcysteine O-methyltransferase Ste14
MSRFVAFLYGLVSYLTFFFTFLYAIGFVSILLVPKAIDIRVATPIEQAVIIDLLLMSLFAIQPSVMATAYTFVGIFLEERDLVDLFGEGYLRSRKQVSMLLPWRRAS